MKEDIDDGGPVYPRVTDQYLINSDGMSVRAHIAALMLPQLAQLFTTNGDATRSVMYQAEATGMSACDVLAVDAVNHADALIRALKNPAQQVVKSFDPTSFTFAERREMAALVSLFGFTDLPTDIQSQARACDKYIVDHDKLFEDDCPF